VVGVVSLHHYDRDLSLALNLVRSATGRGTDSQGNSSPWVYGARAAARPRRRRAVTYAGAWTSVSAADASGGSLRYAIAAGASHVQLHRIERRLGVVLGPDRGSANVSSTVSSRRRSTCPRRASSRADRLCLHLGANGAHHQVVVLGTPGTPVDIDGWANPAALRIARG
jgi:hypothetical protein